ncbi:hypothetical protein [Pseudanabaena sp. FACHB-2040]|uniref:hypothetical protein n=1 Tax=Pseudanabaena sp. FACHB-2040 TaxID=2692859 RepID=UPI0032206DCA
MDTNRPKTCRLNPQAGFPKAYPPPLESGDRFTLPEFERRYAAAHIKKAELIECGY